MKARLIVVALAVGVAVAGGCGDDGGGDADEGREALEDIGAAMDEAGEECKGLLAAGKAFSADDVETCQDGSMSGGYSSRSAR